MELEQNSKDILDYYGTSDVDPIRKSALKRLALRKITYQVVTYQVVTYQVGK